MAFEEAALLRRHGLFVAAFDMMALDIELKDGEVAQDLMLSIFPERDVVWTGEEWDCVKSELNGAKRLVCLYEESSEGGHILRGVFNRDVLIREYLDVVLTKLNFGQPDGEWILVDVEVDYNDPDVSFTPDHLCEEEVA